MPIIEMKMPKMGESIFEATVLDWLVKEGQRVSVDDMIIEVATDKIDTEVGSEISGTITKFLVKKGEVAKIGAPICLIDADENQSVAQASEEENIDIQYFNDQLSLATNLISNLPIKSSAEGGKYYSPLILSIAKEENISKSELETVKGSGADGRVTKDDMMAHLAIKKAEQINQKASNGARFEPEKGDELIPMDRMRKMIAERMLESIKISPHVSSYLECDMTNIVAWREANKNPFKEKHGENITFTPLLIMAIVHAIKTHPTINIQVIDDKVVKKGQINIGMAVGLANGNLIVPVIHNADQLSLAELTKKVNDLNTRARANKLLPAELMGGTYTFSNIGTFGSFAGTPIILQPQVAIMAFGVIEKKAAVMSAPTGDTIAIRSKMTISHSYDHRVVDGLLGGMFSKAVAEWFENFTELEY